jgi:hypothetical protein
MNAFLADLYGTGQAIGADDSSDDVAKLAEAQILDNMFKSEGIDVDDLDDQTVLKIAHEIFGDESALVKSAQEGGEEEAASEPEKCKECGKAECECPAKEAADVEKNAADADLMGRIMAHAMVQELGNIEKEASVGQALKNWGQLAGFGAKQVGGKAKGLAGAAAAKGKGAAGAVKGKGQSMKETYETARKGVIGKGPSGDKGRLGSLAAVAKEHPKTVGGAAGLAALGAGGAAAAGGDDKKKAASALDTLAEQRALEILAEHGVEPEMDAETKLASAIEERAWEMLAENGYVSEE